MLQTKTKQQMVCLFVVDIKDCWEMFLGIKLVFLLDSVGRLHTRDNKRWEQTNHQTSVSSLDYFVCACVCVRASSRGILFRRHRRFFWRLNCALGFVHTHSWPLSHLPLWQLALCFFLKYLSLSSHFCSFSPQAPSPSSPVRSHLKILYSLRCYSFQPSGSFCAKPVVVGFNWLNLMETLLFLHLWTFLNW